MNSTHLRRNRTPRATFLPTPRALVLAAALALLALASSLARSSPSATPRPGASSRVVIVTHSSGASQAEARSASRHRNPLMPTVENLGRAVLGGLPLKR